MDSWIILLHSVVVGHELAKMKKYKLDFLCCQKCFVDFLLLALFFTLAKIVLLLTYLCNFSNPNSTQYKHHTPKYGFIGKKKNVYSIRLQSKIPYTMCGVVLHLDLWLDLIHSVVVENQLAKMKYTLDFFC